MFIRLNYIDIRLTFLLPHFNQNRKIKEIGMTFITFSSMYDAIPKSILGYIYSKSNSMLNPQFKF